MDVHDRALALIGPLYDTTLAPDRWPEFLERLRCTLGAAIAAVHVPRPREPAPLVLSAQAPVEALREYGEHYYQQDLWVQEAWRRPAGTVATGEMLVSEPVLRRTAFYNDFLVPAESAHVCTVVLSREPPHLSVVSVMRPASIGAFTSEDVQLFTLLAPHFRRAVTIQQRLLELTSDREAAAAILDHVQLGVLLLGADGRVLHANRAAESLLRRGDGLSLVRGRLQAATADQSAALFRAVGAATRSQPDHIGGALRIRRPSRRRDLEVIVAPLRGGPEIGEALGASPLAAALFVRDPESVTLPEAGDLRSRFGLTPSEARLAVGLCSGASIPDLGDRLHVSRNTLRTQLKSIFRKTGTHRQIELVGLLLASAPAAVPPLSVRS